MLPRRPIFRRPARRNTLLGRSPVLLSARAEFLRGIQSAGQDPTGAWESVLPPSGGVSHRHFAGYRNGDPRGAARNLPEEGFRIKTVQTGGARYLIIAGGARREAFSTESLHFSGGSLCADL